MANNFLFFGLRLIKFIDLNIFEKALMQQKSGTCINFQK
jgi:hypothetical protein